MEETAARRAAETLFAEHKAGVLFISLGPQDGPAAISDAYDIQDRFVSLLRPQHGDTVGYKVGLTSVPMQTFCGINHPIAGAVLARRVHHSGTTVRLEDFGRLGLEFEIAVRIKSDIAVGEKPHTASTIQPHIDGVCAAIELVRARTRHPGPSLQFGRMACQSARIARPGTQSRPSRHDRKRDEDRLSDGKRFLSFRHRRNRACRSPCRRIATRRAAAPRLRVSARAASPAMMHPGSRGAPARLSGPLRLCAISRRQRRPSFTKLEIFSFTAASLSRESKIPEGFGPRFTT